jgi:hypothetical protein
LFHGDRRTDMTKLIVAFRSFANALKKRREETPRAKPLLGKQQFHRESSNYPSFDETRRFITVFTTARHTNPFHALPSISWTQIRNSKRKTQTETQ